MKYRSKNGAVFGDKKAQIYGEVLEEISKKNDGSITPQEVLKEAKKKENPLHDYFEWDNKKASESWRIHQARNLINSIEVVITYNGTKKEQKRYVNVRNNDFEDDDETSRVYVVIEKAMSDPEMRKEVLQTAIREVEYWEYKYKEYKELSKIFQSISTTKAKLKIFN